MARSRGGIRLSVLVMDNRIYFESVSLISYLRALERQSRDAGPDDQGGFDAGAADAFRRVGDGLALTELEAFDWSTRKGK